jgi:multicomponent Na+:H+ antiporter subunit A
MIVVLLASAVVGLGLIACGARLGRHAFLVALAPVALALGTTIAWLGDATGGVPRLEHASWVTGLDLSVDLRMDGPAATMSLVVAGVGVLVLLYAWRYFRPDAPDLGRLAGLLVLFAGAMLGLVQADHVLVLYTCWELTTVTSYLLIGNAHEDARARAAALHALLVTGAGGLAMLGGLLVLAAEAGSFRIQDILTSRPSGTAVTVAMALLVVGAVTKSAQYPFHAWLPGAMAAPTPVSAYLHSATMVKAGVFLLARFGPLFAETAGWRPALLAAGCCTLVFGGLRSLRQHDLKLLLAFGTVSQLGLLVVLFGAGTPDAATAGWVLLLAHAAFKAALFMVVGVIDHQAGTRDIRLLPPLTGPRWRAVEVVSAISLASMAGVPLAAGFIAKEAGYEALASGTFAGHDLVLAAAVLGSALTAAYALRFHLGAFVRPRREARRDAQGRELVPPPPPGAGFVAPAAVLSVAGLVLGLAPGLADPLVEADVAAYRPVAPVHLALWHGVNLPLALSALALLGGAAVALADRWVQPLLALGHRIPSGAEIYLACLRGLGRASARTTAIVQNGSLPVYAGVILLTAAALPVAAVAGGVQWPGWPALGSAREAPVAIALLVAALGAAIVRRRFSAAVFLGVAGYAMAGLFVLSGAPDLALTQVAVETLSTVLFVLVLRRLPARFERQSSPGRRLVRLAVAAAVAAMVFVFALVASGYRISPPVSDRMVSRAVPDGHGRNVVNVILVDFRGFDTLGEITVLGVASIGAVALARVGHRAARARGETAPPPGPGPRRLVFVDTAVRLVFHAILMTSLWLLFAGHNQPGGGFVGGLLAGSAIALRYVAGGMAEVRRRSRFPAWHVLGAGLLLAGLTAVVPLLLGGEVLEIGLGTLDLPLIGDVKVSSALVFDAGVYLAVVGMVLMVFEAFGDEPAEAVP